MALILTQRAQSAGPVKPLLLTAFRQDDYDVANKKPLLIGFGAEDYFKGSMSELRIYDRAPTEREIHMLIRRFP